MSDGSISRREFLAVAGAAALAGCATSRGPEVDPPVPDRRLGFAFVGLGSFAVGQLLPHIKNCKYCKPVALVSGHPDKAARVAPQYGIDSKNIYNYENYDSIRDNPAIDVVYVVLPNSMHGEYVIRAFGAGKHVMCEKPMAPTAAECQKMIDAGKAAGKKLQIGYRQHFDNPTLACIEALRRGDIGDVEIVSCATGFNIGDPTQWRLNRKLAGGGCLVDIGIYSLNAARYLTGAEPTEVFAHTVQDVNDPRFKEVEQHCDFQLKFPGGVLASCESSYAVGLDRFQVYGTKGQAALDPGQSYSNSRFYKSLGRAGMQEVVMPHNDQFAGEMDGFAEVIAGTGAERASGEEGMKDVRIIEAIYESAGNGRVVRL